MRATVLAIAVVALIVANVAHAWRECGAGSGTDGQENLPCPGNACCSAYGFCGMSPVHCGPGCQNGQCTGKDVDRSVTFSSDGQCGIDGPYCRPDSCCSLTGYCGDSEVHCGAGCQHGRCDSGYIDPLTLALGRRGIVAPPTKIIPTSMPHTNKTHDSQMRNKTRYGADNSSAAATNNSSASAFKRKSENVSAALAAFSIFLISAILMF